MDFGLVLVLLVAFCTFEVKTSFINPYPRYQKHDDGGDPGNPLFLTPFIEKEALVEARNASKVSGQIFESIEGYSGYLTVNKKFNSNLFFWYFPAKTNPEEAPVVLWLQGGPGASSLFGLFTENGPYQLTSKGKIQKRTFSWHVNHHLIYIDNPVGTGFSFTDEDEGYCKNEQDVGRDLKAAIEQIFTLFPNLQELEFYITGESYAGKYVPALAYTILKSEQRLKKLGQTTNVKINLKGIAMGNGLTDPIHQLKYGDYLYQIGLIDANGRDKFHEEERAGVTCIKQNNMTCAFDIFDRLINMDELPSGSIFKNLTGYTQYFNYLKTSSDESDDTLGKFLQLSDTRRQIHVGNLSFHDLEGENKVEQYLKNDVMRSIAQWVAELLSHYRVLVYNGQLDVIVAYPLTLSYLQKLRFDGADQYKTAPRHIWKVGNEIAGYVKMGGNLIEALVRNAGHMAPADQPKWVWDLISRLTHKKFNLTMED